MPQDQKDELNKMIKKEVKDFFGNKIIGDNPTDMLQLVNKRYFVTGGPGSIMGAASVMTIDPNKGRLFKINTSSSVTTVTVNASVAGLYGQQIQFLIGNDSAAARTVVFSSLMGNASVVGLRSSVAAISFVSDSTRFYEYARTQGL